MRYTAAFFGAITSALAAERFDIGWAVLFALFALILVISKSTDLLRDAIKSNKP